MFLPNQTPSFVAFLLCFLQFLLHLQLGVRDDTFLSKFRLQFLLYGNGVSVADEGEREETQEKKQIKQERKSPNKRREEGKQGEKIKR